MTSFTNWKLAGLVAVAVAATLLLLGETGIVSRSDEPTAITGHDHGREADDDEIAYYTCPMHPSVREAKPGTCPICSMDLVPVLRSEAETAQITVDAERRQTIGVRTVPVKRLAMTASIRAAGRVTYDERSLTDVSLKYRGWIGELVANTSGQRIDRGQPLFTIYSPELYAAQQELQTAVASQQRAAASGAPDRADYLVDAARARLRLWDLSDHQIDAVARASAPERYLPILSPVTGTVIEKNVVEGAAVEPGERLFRIAALESVWIEADVFASDLGRIDEGAAATVRFPYLDDLEVTGKVAFVYPYLDDATRTARVRIEVDNRELTLKPDMYADVTIDVDLGERLVVPEEAVLYVGERRFVFVDLGDGKLAPRKITTGYTSAEATEVVEGLGEGDVVVASGNFLIAAESRLKRALEQWQ